MASSLSRRQFIAAAAAGTALAATNRVSASQTTDTPPVCVFSKHLQWIRDWDDLAATYEDLGTDGCDLTVRRGGHIAPDDAAKELPRCVEAFRKRGLDIHMITTRLERGDEPEARKTLEAAAKEGIKYFRCGTGRYSNEGTILEQLKQYTESLRALAELAAEFDMVGGYHNHSGPNYIGAPLWDLYHVLEDIDSPHMGSNFDLGHATVEGAYGAWRTNTRLLAPYVKMCAAKDFVWTDDGGPEWVPLGEGRVNGTEMLAILRDADFSGPLSVHLEYDTGSRRQTLGHMRNDVAAIRRDLERAGYPT